MNKELEIIGIYNIENNPDVHLIELRYSSDSINMMDFTQEIESLPTSSWQAPYDERFLDQEGLNIVEEQTKGNIRIVFFFHFIDFNKPLVTPEGNKILPMPTEIPDRLAKIIKYEEVD